MDEPRFATTSIDPKRLRIEHSVLPETVFDPRFLFWRCTVRVLVVTDSTSGGYGTSAGFHLGQVLDIIQDDPWSHIAFKFTRAHRQTGDAATDDHNFRFDNHDLSQYSQIWMFGISRTSDALSEDELRALAEFMDAGGGVLAMGDHENLGQAMCAEVPRVRNMRRWYHGPGAPSGAPLAPDQTGPGSHDTLVGGGTQTDPVPQMIYPVYWTRVSWKGGFLRRVVRYPHPVLCGPEGVINYLPDHMHEGLCEVPTDLTATLTFSGQNFTEYPTVSGHQERPVEIAHADNNMSSSRFGVLAAYDGHRVDVGRVLVDATWHHWFNINITPYVNATDPAHVTYTPATEPKWEEIKAYFRNVGVWLARPSLQRCIRNGGWLRVIGDYDIFITVRDLDLVPHPLPYFWQVGTFAKDALGRGARQCQVVRWIIDILYERAVFPIDPWRQLGREEREVALPSGLDLDEVETVLIGAAVHGLSQQYAGLPAPEKLLEKNDGEEIADVMRKSLRFGKQALANHAQTCKDSSDEFLKALP